MEPWPVLIREERVSCSCGEILVVEYQEREAPPGAAGTLVDYTCPRCSRTGRVKLHSAAAQFIVRRATDTPVFPRLPDA
jgi:hypothetical protein